jgi:fatty-acyl-CoA synthase
MTPDSVIELDWLKRWAMYSPAAIALQSGEDGRHFTYRELYARSNRIARVLRERFSIAKGDRVAAVVQNELDYVSLFFAVQRLGAILVPVNFRFARPEAEHICRDSGAKLVVAEKIFLPLVSSFKTWDFEDLVLAASAKDFSEIPFVSGFEDPCMILYTSGTTGFPKGAVLSYRMIHWNSVNTGLRLNLTSDDVVLTFLPLFHTGGWNVLTTPCLHRGAKVVLLKKFDPELVLSLTAKEKVTVLFGVPTTMDFLSRSPAFAGADLSSLRYAIVGGEPMPLPLIDVWEGRGVPVRQGYGLTEFGPNVFSLNEADSRRKAGSIGFPNFYIEAKVADGAGNEVPPDEIGELVLKGPVAMSGYWQNEKATNETIKNGWLHTGDLVRRDGEGYFYVVGRKKEMFISGGENVYPAEVEKVLRALPGVREAAVVGVPHQKWGECGKAFVSFEDGQSLSVEDMREFCLSQLAKFKVPLEYVIMKDLPKTESGKISKKSLVTIS